MTVGLGVRTGDMSDFTAKKSTGGYHAENAEPPFGTIATIPPAAPAPLLKMRRGVLSQRVPGFCNPALT